MAKPRETCSLAKGLIFRTDRAGQGIWVQGVIYYGSCLQFWGPINNIPIMHHEFWHNSCTHTLFKFRLPRKSVSVIISWFLLSFHNPQGPFVHIASICAAVLSRVMAIFTGVYEVKLPTALQWQCVLMAQIRAALAWELFISMFMLAHRMIAVFNADLWSDLLFH